MAKENFVLLMGELVDTPQVNKVGNKSRFTIKTLRRNGKIDNPIITVFDENIVSKVKDLEKGTFVMVRGLLATLSVMKTSVCECCGTKNKSEGTLTSVIAIDVIDMGKQHTLENVKEFSNNIILVGTVVNDPVFRVLPSGVSNISYEIAINRKYHVKNQDVNQKSDYPWVSSFAKQAEEDNKRLQKRSQILISGGIQTRVIKRKIECSNCHSIMESEDVVGEIVPYSIEYLNNCIFTEEEKEQQKVNNQNEEI